jgi:hypothetical protein
MILKEFVEREIIRVGATPILIAFGTSNEH